MRILSIETSCDETSAAIINNGTEIEKLTVSSSVKLHFKTGGIIPETAAREQLRYIIPVLEETAGTKDFMDSLKNIDALAVTAGPGLIGSLLIGVETAKTIAMVSGKPIVPVNHILAHLYANWLEGRKPLFPAIALVVSGGHTELFLMSDHGKLKWIGGTRDDAAGEAFDKTARILGLGYPGGPAVAAAAAKTPIPNKQYPITKLPRPMIGSGTLEFSFSGLKTAVMKEKSRIETAGQWNDNSVSQLAFEIQESITDVLVSKTLAAAKTHSAKSIILGGGVAANKRLTEKMKLEIGKWKMGIDVHIPSPYLCTDNAAYIGSFAYFNFHPVPWQDIQAQPDMEIEIG